MLNTYILQAFFPIDNDFDGIPDYRGCTTAPTPTPTDPPICDLGRVDNCIPGNVSIAPGSDRPGHNPNQANWDNDLYGDICDNVWCILFVFYTTTNEP